MRTKKAPISQKWMFSFADLLSLILTFFVLIYSMADPMQLTNILKNDNNSAIALERGNEETKIKLSLPKNLIDDDYLMQVFADKIANDEGMQIFKTKTENDRFYISTKAELIKPTSTQALFETISRFDNDKKIVAGTLDIARNFALELKKYGKIENLSYFEKSELADKIEVIIYPQF